VVRMAEELYRKAMHFQEELVESQWRVSLAYPTLRKEREGWGTRQLVAGMEQKGAGRERKAVVGRELQIPPLRSG